VSVSVETAKSAADQTLVKLTGTLTLPAPAFPAVLLISDSG
jgi:hypothetical protein